MKRVSIDIEGMTCSNCENHVRKELEKIGAKKIKVSVKDKSAIFNIEDDAAQNLIKDAIKTAGYTVKDIIFGSHGDDPIQRTAPKLKKGFFGRLF